jgi:capsular exopolysaccharide synthesis family protein
MASNELERVRIPPPELEGLYPPEPDAEVHLRDYLYVVLKRRWIVIAITITALAVSAVWTLRQTPVYTATALVQISRGKLDPLHGVTTYDSWVDYAEFYPTQENILRSYNMSYRVVESLRLWEHPFFNRGSEGSNPGPEKIKGLAGSVLSMSSVSQVKQTQLMRVSFTSPDPELSALLANALVSQYISFNSRTETEMARDTVTFLGDQIERLEEEIREKENLLRDYSQRDDIILMDQKEDIVFEQLKDLNRQAAKVRGEVAAAEARYRGLRDSDPISLESVQRSPKIVDLERRRALLQEELEELSSRFESDWPELKRARESLEQVELRLGEETNAVAQKVVEAARMEFQAVQERERLLQGAVEEKKREARRLNRLTADYKRIRSELENKQAVLDQLLRRHSEMGMSAERGEGTVNVRLVDEALVPSRPSGPNLRGNLMMGAMVGLSLGIGLVFFLDYWDTSIRTVEDLRRHLSLPLLGMVPRYEAEPVPVGEDGQTMRLLLASGSGWRVPRQAVEKDFVVTKSSLALSEGTDSSGPSDPIRESSRVGERFKFIRGSLLMSSPGKPPKVVLITGPEKNAGKTFVSCNLAASLAELDKKVLLIDADLRNPQIHRVFGVRNEEGLSNVLTGQADIANGCIIASSIPNVFLLSAGRSSPSPSELLSSEQMEAVLARCAERFDFVLLDSAPLLPVFDTHVLTARCDTSVLVVRSGFTSRAAVKTSLELVERVGGKFGGVILNGVHPRDSAEGYYYGYRGYGYGYGYGADRSHESTDVAT